MKFAGGVRVWSNQYSFMGNNTVSTTYSRSRMPQCIVTNQVLLNMTDNQHNRKPINVIMATMTTRKAQILLPFLSER